MAYEDMPAKALKHIYKDRELAHSGKKPEVIARLGEHSQNKLKRKPPENDNTEQDKKERTSKKAKIEGGDPDYDKQNVKRLQDLCFSRRLSEKPSDKAALIARLEANDRGEDEPGQECPICGNVRAFKFYGHSSHGSHDASANQSKGCGQECQWCSRDYIMSCLTDGIAPEDIQCMWCTKSLAQADVRRHLSKHKPDYQAYLSTESWRAHQKHQTFHLCQAPACSEGGIIDMNDIINECKGFNCRPDGTGHENCLPCKAVHKPGETCEAYQAPLNHTRRPIDEASTFLRDHVSKPCPRCGIYISKTGCHQVRCIAEVRPSIKCNHVFCYDCGKHTNSGDGYRKTGHEDGCPQDGPGTKSARNKRESRLGLDN